MSRYLQVAALAAGCVLCTSTAVSAQAEPLRVGVKETPPFAIRSEDGTWSGLSVDLWNDMVDRLGLDYVWRPTDLAGLVNGLSDSTLDVVVGALTITADREAHFDFSHPFYSTGIGIATSADASRGWIGVLEQLFSWDFFRVVGALLVLLFMVGVLVWYFERRKNPEQFGGNRAQGIGSGFWWSAVTMTTVGYGDKAPRSLRGRLLAVIWMFAALMLVASFTGSIASILTLSRLESRIESPTDLRRMRVATVTASTSAAYLTREGIAYREFADAETCLHALAHGQVDVVVYDRPILRYLVKEKFAGELAVPSLRLERQDYGFGLIEGSALREPLNRALLEIIQAPVWADRIGFYLGSS